jgi:hypothetical protein
MLLSRVTKQMGRTMSEENNHTAKNTLGKVGLILGIVVGMITIGVWIESVVTRKLKDPEVIKQIAALVRPSMIFDHNGVITSDSGAKQFIENISVEMGPEEPSKIIITPKEHLNSRPILECLNWNFDIKANRGNQSDWIFELSSPTYVVMDESPKTKEWVFRLEIVR